MGVEGAGSDDGAEFGSGPFDFPGGCSLYFDDAVLVPFISFFEVHSDDFIAAGSCHSASCPVEAHVVNDDFGGQVSDAVDVGLLNHELIITISY